MITPSVYPNDMPLSNSEPKLEPLTTWVIAGRMYRRCCRYVVVMWLCDQLNEPCMRIFNRRLHWQSLSFSPCHCPARRIQVGSEGGDITVICGTCHRGQGGPNGVADSCRCAKEAGYIADI